GQSRHLRRGEVARQRRDLRGGQSSHLASRQQLGRAAGRRRGLVGGEGGDVLGGDRLQLRRVQGADGGAGRAAYLRWAQSRNLTRSDVGTEGVDLIRREGADFLGGDRLHLVGRQTADHRAAQTRSLRRGQSRHLRGGEVARQGRDLRSGQCSHLARRQ